MRRSIRCLERSNRVVSETCDWYCNSLCPRRPLWDTPIERQRRGHAAARGVRHDLFRRGVAGRLARDAVLMRLAQMAAGDLLAELRQQRRQARLRVDRFV